MLYSSAFKNSNLSSIYIPENIVSIGDSVFENCSNLKTVEFAANSPITTLEYSLFKNCNNLEYVKNINNILKIEEERITTNQNISLRNFKSIDTALFFCQIFF